MDNELITDSPTDTPTVYLVRGADDAQGRESWLVRVVPRGADAPLTLGRFRSARVADDQRARWQIVIAALESHYAETCGGVPHGHDWRTLQ